MINNLIFSKNRACQLHALLSSLEEYDRGMFQHKVIYTHDKEYAKGYEIVKKLHPKVRFIKEENLKANIFSNMDTEFSSFCVDDQIMYRQSPVIDLGTLRALKDTCFSLRLGANISEPHLSYPLSLDGHIYKTEDIKPLIESIVFNNPNKLESKLQKCKAGWDILWKYQCIISLPHNRVSSKSKCVFSGLYSQEILNDYFVDGFEIDYSRMDFSNLTNVHAIINYKFKSR